MPEGIEPHFSRYIRFITTRPDRGPSRQKGFERHHILPRVFDGQDISENYILLTPREHYIAHLMLWKCYGGKMAYAFRMMSHRVIHVQLTSRQYENLRQETQEAFIQNGRSHKGRKRSPETCQRLSRASSARMALRKGVPLSESHKKALREAAKHKKPRSLETLKKIADGCRQRRDEGKGCRVFRIVHIDGREFFTTKGLSAFCRENNISMGIWMCKDTGRPYCGQWYIWSIPKDTNN